jgi:hypothetical protein
MNAKMPKGQPMVEVFKVYPWCYSKWMPLKIDKFKFCICVIKCFGILVVFVNFHVFCSQVWHPNKPIGVNLHGLNLMEKTSFFFVMQWLGRVSWWAKHNVDNIPICLSTINDEPFKLWHVNDTFAFMTFTRALHIRTWDSTSFDCMSHVTLSWLWHSLGHRHGMPW